MKFITRAERIVSVIAHMPATALHVIAVVIFVGIVRRVLESFVVPAGAPAELWTILPLVHSIVFYVAMFFLFLLALGTLLPREEIKVRSVVLAGIFLGLLPPLMHIILSGQGVYFRYFSEFNWHLFAPYQPLSESVVLWMVIASMGAYCWYKTRKILYFVLGIVVSYLLVQFSLWVIGEILVVLLHFVPPIAALGKEVVTLQTLPVINNPLFPQTLLTLLLAYVAVAAFMIHRYQFFIATFRRWPHAIIWGVLVLLGAQITTEINLYSVFAALTFVLAFILIQAENDYYDKTLDTHTNRASVITNDDLLLVRFFMVLLVLTFVSLDPGMSMLLTAFFLLGFVYHHNAFRLKKHFITASFIEGSLAAVALLSGLPPSFNQLSDSVILFVVAIAILFGVFSNVRDYKDFLGDKKEGVRTLYVWAADRGMAPATLHLTLVVPMLVTSGAILLGYLLFGYPTPLVALAAAALICITPLPLILLHAPRKSTTAAISYMTASIFFITLFVAPLFV